MVIYTHVCSVCILNILTGYVWLNSLTCTLRTFQSMYYNLTHCVSGKWTIPVFRLESSKTNVKLLLNFMFCWPCVSIYACNETNSMHRLSSVYSVTIPLHVSGLLATHHQDVIMYICDNWYVFCVLVDCRRACMDADSGLRRTIRTNCHSIQARRHSTKT
jgi:hypothetical protein